MAHGSQELRLSTVLTSRIVDIIGYLVTDNDRPLFIAEKLIFEDGTEADLVGLWDPEGSVALGEHAKIDTKLRKLAPNFR